MEKAQLLEQFAVAYEQLIEAAVLAGRRGEAQQADGWGPNQVVAHLAGWETMATVRIPAILTGTPPMEFVDPTQGRVMNDAINSAFVTLAGDQSLETLCDKLRQAYQRTIEILTPLDERLFQTGEYVYERTQGVIAHCHEHRDVHLSAGV
jgi:hypothetical protein